MIIPFMHLYIQDHWFIAQLQLNIKFNKNDLQLFLGLLVIVNTAHGNKSVYGVRPGLASSDNV